MGLNRSKSCAWGVGLLISSITAALAHGQISWPRPDQSFEPGLTDKDVVAEFEFVNDGDSPVKITSIKTTCGCTTAKLAKRTYQPGEGGKIVSTFTIGKRRGTQVKEIKVHTDHPDHPSHVLVIRVKIPELLKILPPYVYWQESEPREPKTMRVTMTEDTPVQLKSVDTTNKAFSVSFEPIQDEKAYRITVTPPPTEQTFAGTILLLKTDFPSSETPRTFTAFARVIPASDPVAPLPGPLPAP